MIVAKKSLRSIPRRRLHRRTGAVLVEMALVAPILFLLLIGIIVGGLGVFRYHQVAALAHASARWASVHGKDYAKTNGSVATAEDIYKNVIQPKAVALDKSKLSYQLDWGPDGSTVVVTVRYQWIPEAFFNNATFSSRAEMLVSY